jgi:hypothetical protein
LLRQVPSSEENLLTLSQRVEKLVAHISWGEPVFVMPTPPALAILVADFDGSRPFKPPFKLGLMFEGDMFAGQEPLFSQNCIYPRGFDRGHIFNGGAVANLDSGLKSFLGSRERKFDGEAAQGRIMGVRREYSRRCTLQDETLSARLLGGLLRSNKFRNSQFIKML